MNSNFSNPIKDLNTLNRLLSGGFFVTFRIQKSITMIRRKVNSVQEALQGVTDGMTLMLGGF
ncbi:MAG: hypothetical protein ACK4FS_08485, partial [Flavobacterium sp.]